MKKNYTNPEVEIIKLSAADVLATSYNYNFNDSDPFETWEW